MSIKSFVECFVSIKTAPDLSQFLIAETALGEGTLEPSVVDEVHGDRVLVFLDTNRNAIHSVYDFELMTVHSKTSFGLDSRGYILEKSSFTHR